MVYGKIFGKISSETVGTAMDAANCVAGFQGMATADVTNGAAAGRYFNEALGAVMACSGKVFMDLAKGKMLDVLAVSVAQVFTWVWSGIQTAAHGLAAAADTALNFKGYTIAMTNPEKPVHPAPSAKGTTTHEVIAEGVHLMFDIPVGWQVTGPPAKGKILNASGTEVATFDVVQTWGAVAARCQCVQ